MQNVISPPSDGLIAAGAMGARMAGLPGPVATGLGLAAKGIQALGNPYKLGAGIKGMVDVMSKMGPAVDGVTQSIQNGAKAIFNSSNARAVSQGVGKGVENYKQMSDKIHELASDPQAMLNHITNATQGMQEIPNVQSAIQMAAQNMIGYAHSKYPQAPNHLPLNSVYKVTPVQQRTYEKLIKITLNPIFHTMNSLKNGSYDSETHDVLTNAYPQLKKEMQQRVMSEMTPQNVAKLNYSKKISLQRFMDGQPLENSMQPQVLAANQAVFAGPQPQPAQGGGKGKKSPLGGLKELDLASRMTPGTQHLESEA